MEEATKRRKTPDRSRDQKVDTSYMVIQSYVGQSKNKRRLAKIGIRVSDSTVRKHKPLIRKPPSQTWLTFLRNHMKETVAIDFFVVPTVGFRLLYLFIISSHDRRRVIFFNVTDSPSAKWTGQQIINAFPYDTAPKYLLRNNDSVYKS